MEQEKFEIIGKVSKLSRNRYYVNVPEPLGSMLYGVKCRIIIIPLERFSKRGV